MFTDIEFSATALGISPLSSINSYKNDCLQGESRQLQRPVKNAKNSIIGYDAKPKTTLRAKIKDVKQSPVWVIFSISFLSILSNSAPENSEKTRSGKNCTAATIPTNVALFVTSSASQG